MLWLKGSQFVVGQCERKYGGIIGVLPQLGLDMRATGLYSPDDFLNALLLVMREVLTSGNVPSSWQRTFFKMLPKTKAAKSVSDFRPIANVRLLYQLFAYLLLGPMEAHWRQVNSEHLIWIVQVIYFLGRQG